MRRDGGHVYTYRGHSSYVYAVAWFRWHTHRLGGGHKTVQVWQRVEDLYEMNNQLQHVVSCIQGVDRVSVPSREEKLILLCWG